MKITIDRSLLEQAIDALQAPVETVNTVAMKSKASAALCEALAQPQQEPVAEVQVKMTGGNAGIATVIREIYDPLREPLQPGDKLYTSPPASTATSEDVRLARG